MLLVMSKPCMQCLQSLTFAWIIESWRQLLRPLRPLNKISFGGSHHTNTARPKASKSRLDLEEPSKLGSVATDDDVVNGDEDKLHRVTDEAHDGKANAACN